MMGGSEWIVVNLAKEFAKQHQVTVRLPRAMEEVVWGGVRWIGSNSPSESFDALYSHDDFQPVDKANRTILVAARSDPPRHRDFDRIVFLSKTHRDLMGGHSSDTWIGGGVNLDDYVRGQRRLPRRVIASSSPDRCSKAAVIGEPYDFIHTYKPIQGYKSSEMDRSALVNLQQTARVFIYPLDPNRPSDFFSMATLEAMAAGTPVIISNADSMEELWSEAAIVLPRPIRINDWQDKIDELLDYPRYWVDYSKAGKELAKKYSWPRVAASYLKVANGDNI